MEVEKYAAQPEKVGVLLKLLSTWRTRKRNELGVHFHRGMVSEQDCSRPSD